MTQEISALLPSGMHLHFTQKRHESGPEFDGRVQLAIENALGGLPLTEGTRWAQWNHNSPHALRCFHTNGLGVVYESTGERYQNRKRRIPGLYDQGEAMKEINRGS